MKLLKEKIYKIGQNMVTCEQDCKGIRREPSKGVIPRCLVLEERVGDKGLVIVGRNPGPSGRSEREYVQKEPTYERWLDFFDTKIRNLRYYKGLRILSDKLGFAGSILWTEIVKCENKDSKNRSPLKPKTVADCTKRYLLRELDAEPIIHWPIIALGMEAYRETSKLFPNRAIIGIPHPTGSFQFNSILNNNQLINRLRKLIHGYLLADDCRHTIWIREKSDGTCEIVISVESKNYEES